MPRQPFLPYFLAHRNGTFDVNLEAIRRQSELELLVGRCITAWPLAEAEMAVVFGQLIGVADSPVVLAVFETIRRSSAQYEAIKTAADVAITDPLDRELLETIVTLHRSAEKERNALVHGHFGTYSTLEDGLVWMDTRTYIDARTRIAVLQSMPHDRVDEMYANTFIYKANDLQTVFDCIEDIGDLWHNFSRLLRIPLDQRHGSLYSELCQMPRVAQELSRRRRENGAEAPTQSPPPNAGTTG
jgi:hypothetical protein